MSYYPPGPDGPQPTPAWSPTPAASPVHATTPATGQYYGAPVAPPRREPRPHIGAALGVFGLVLAPVGAFSLPVETYGSGRPGQSIYASVYLDIAREDHHDILLKGFAAFWWGYGLYLTLALLSVALAWTVIGAARTAGVALLVLAVLGGIAHLVALTGTADYVRAVRSFGADGNVLKHPGSGVWVALAGFAVLAVAGLLTVIQGRRRVTGS